MELKEINRRLKVIQTNGVKFNEYIHATAMGVLRHVNEHRDATVALRLCMAMPASFRRTNMVKWFAKFSPVGLNLSAGKCLLHKEGSKSYTEWNIPGADIEPFFALAEAQEEETPDTTIEDVEKKIISFAASLQKKLDDKKVAEADIPAITAKVAAIKALAA